MPFHFFDCDAGAGELVKSYLPDYQLSAPRPALAFTGPLVVLVGPLCASACVHFTPHLQALVRATVVGQYGTIVGLATKKLFDGGAIL